MSLFKDGGFDHTGLSHGAGPGWKTNHVIESRGFVLASTTHILKLEQQVGALEFHGIS